MKQRRRNKNREPHLHFEKGLVRNRDFFFYRPNSKYNNNNNIDNNNASNNNDIDNHDDYDNDKDNKNNKND